MTNPTAKLDSETYAVTQRDANGEPTSYNFNNDPLDDDITNRLRVSGILSR